ncbi:MAG: LamG domain-containing protein [Candidatus Saccharibacteria bacterium]
MKKIHIFLKISAILLTVGLILAAFSVRAYADSGLIGYWNFDEASGSAYADSSENVNDGTIVGTGVNHSTDVAPISCFSDPYSVSFDGSGGYVSIPDSASMDPTSQISIAFWMNANTVNNGYQHIIFKQGPVVTSYGVWLFNNHIYMEDNDNTVRSLTSNATINTGTWYYITVTYDGQTQKLYVDGNLDNSQSLPGITLSYENSPIKIGSGDYNNPFSGYVDDLRIYSTALSQNQVTDLAGGGCGPGVLSSQPSPDTQNTDPPTTTVSTDPAPHAPDTGYGAPHNSSTPKLIGLIGLSMIIGSVIFQSRIYLYLYKLTTTL